MKEITVTGLSDVTFVGLHPYNGHIRPRETSRICIGMTDCKCSCDIGMLDSHYLLQKEIECVYGEAKSLFDRALEKAVSVMVHDERARVSINMPGKYINENLSGDIYVECNVHLIILESSKAVYELSDDEKLAIAMKYKNMGVELYKESRAPKHMSAYLFFCQAMKWFSMISKKDLEGKTEEFKAMKMQCYNNLALYHLQQKHYPLVVVAATRVLEDKSTNIKALYRRSVANTELQNYEDAEKDIRQALLIDANNGPIKKQQELLKKRQKAVSEKYAVAMKKFFS